MKPVTRSSIVLCCLFTLTCTANLPAWAAVDPREVMEKVDARDDGDNMASDVEMILIDKKGYERKRKIKVFVKDKGRDTHRIQFFLAPADVKDTAFLTYDYYAGEKDDDQWLYLPDLHKTKRIATSDKSSAFMGSDFSYADMTDRVVDEWNYKLLKEDNLDDHKVWLIEALPVSDEVRDRYGYKKSIIFVRQDIFMEVRAIHLLNEGKKVKYMEVKSLELIDDIWVATERTMKTTVAKRTTHRTVLRWTNVSFNNSLQESFFSIRQLEKGL
ncbi:MAG: outer membrane lipoprotein-sorting protein [Desulforhopalus sp.]